MTVLDMPVHVTTVREIAAANLIADAERADLPVPAVGVWLDALPQLLFATREGINLWVDFGLIRVAHGEFVANGCPSQMAFTDGNRPVSVVVSWLPDVQLTDRLVLAGGTK